MAKNRNPDKKAIRKQIEQQLFATFDHLKDEANPKKLARSIRRASKILTAGIKAETSKKRRKEAKAETSKKKRKEAKVTVKATTAAVTAE